MLVKPWIRPFFWIAALYDGLLGIAFLVAHQRIYDALGIPPPNHPAYIQFGAALILAFGLGFALVALDPITNRPIIRLGMLLKISYAGVVLGHWFRGSIPPVWTYFAWADLIFLVIFAAAWYSLSPPRARHGAVP